MILQAILGLNVQQLWPLDSVTCEKETLIDTFSHIQFCDETKFGSQPKDFPYRSMIFDGTNYVDGSVNLPAPTIRHYSVQGFFYMTQKNGVLFHYKAYQSVEEVILSINDGKLKMYRKVKPAIYGPYMGSQLLSLNKWYHLSFAVGAEGYLFAYIDGIRDIIWWPLAVRSTPENPGNLRIGADFDQQKTNFIGLIACVGFYLDTRTPDVTEIQRLCTTTPWMPLRDTNSLYFSCKNDKTLYP